MMLVAACALGGGMYFLHHNLQDVRHNIQENQRMEELVRSVNHLKMTAVSFNLSAMDMLVDSLGADFKGLDPKRLEELEDEKIHYDKNFREMKEETEHFALTGEIKELSENLESLYAAVRGLGDTLKSRKPSESELDKFDTLIDSSKEDALAKIEKILDEIGDKSSALATAQKDALNQMTQNALFTAVFVILSLVIVGASTSRSLMTSMSKVHDQLSKSNRELRSTGDRLAESAQTMASSTAESAAAIQESVSSMAEMTAMLKQTSQHTDAAATLAHDILSRSDEGSRVMSELSESMTRIAAANSKLTEITKIIDDIRGRTNLINDIVFKTQLLSVNASIEAARAGHHGKGFAVVANEVANLATMSGKAATEIGSLLHESVSKVAGIVEGTSESVKGGETTCKTAVKMFASISHSIGDISEKVSQIDIATKEQEAGIRQTSAALAQMNVATTSTSQVARDNAHLGGLLLRQCDRVKGVTNLLTITVFGESVAHERDESNHLTDEASSNEILASGHGDPAIVRGSSTKVLDMTNHELATRIVNKVKSRDPSNSKYTGTDG
jgi:methyl-accepting chemotaxis protein